MNRIERDIDELARRLAGSAGIVWESLNDYPGYSKTCWREKAQAMMHALDPREQAIANPP